MQVGHGLAGVGAVVDHQAEAALKVEFFRDRAGGEQEVSQHGLVVWSGFADAGDHGFRDDEEVDRCGGGDVVDDDAAIILVLDAGGNVAGDDAFKESVHDEWQGGGGSEEEQSQVGVGAGAGGGEVAHVGE